MSHGGGSLNQEINEYVGKKEKELKREKKKHFVWLLWNTVARTRVLYNLPLEIPRA